MRERYVVFCRPRVCDSLVLMADEPNCPADAREQVRKLQGEFRLQPPVPIASMELDSAEEAASWAETMHLGYCRVAPLSKLAPVEAYEIGYDEGYDAGMGGDPRGP